MNHSPEALSLIFHAEDARLEFVRGTVPNPGRGEVLVRCTFATLCRSDLLTYTGKRKERDPTILGHEFTGRVAAIGPEGSITDLRGRILSLGDRITSAIFAADPASDMSVRGMPQKSADLFKYGHERYESGCGHHGGLSEYILLRRYTPVVVLRDDCLTDPLASILNCAVATAAAALRCAGSIEGRRVLVTGAGMLGLVACAMARSDGAAVVEAMDLSPVRAAQALDFGAEKGWQGDAEWPAHLQSSAGKPYPFDVTLDFTGVSSVMSAGLGLLDIGGTAVWVGATYPQEPVPVAAEQIVRRILTVRGIHNYNASDLLRAVDFLEHRHADFPFAALIDGEYPLEDAAEAFRHALEQNPYRAGLRINP